LEIIYTETNALKCNTYKSVDGVTLTSVLQDYLQSFTL